MEFTPRMRATTGAKEVRSELLVAVDAVDGNLDFANATEGE
jgi:hypothetical protein